MKHKLIATLAGLALALGVAGTALGHDVLSAGGTVNCAGAYTITVNADVWLPTTLVVTLNGDPLSNPTPAVGSNHAIIDYVYTGSGASAGQVITARTSDESAEQGASGSLVLTQEVCPTPTPPPTPTPTPTATPRVTPTPSIPVKTPNVTPPPTSTDSVDGQLPNSGPILLLLVAIASTVLLSLVFGRRKRMSGQGLAEYALILALIAIVAVVALMFLGGSISGILSKIGKSV